MLTYRATEVGPALYSKTGQTGGSSTLEQNRTDRGVVHFTAKPDRQGGRPLYLKTGQTGGSSTLPQNWTDRGLVHFTAKLDRQGSRLLYVKTGPLRGIVPFK